jgi:hypothetical protein
VPPLVVFVGAEAVTDLRDKLSEAVRTAAVKDAEHTPHRTDETADGRSNPALPQVNRRVSFDEYLTRAREEWQPDVTVTPAWVRGCNY